MHDWQANASATIVGSMPHRDRRKVIDFIIREIPDIPVWPQLAGFREEQMMVQYLEGLPGLEEHDDLVVVNTGSERFEKELYSFYEECLSVEEGASDLLSSRFAMGRGTGETFSEFLDVLRKSRQPWRAVKGQIVGPFTLLSGMKDQNQRAIIYDDRLQDVVVRHLAMKARWQIVQLRELGAPVIIFLDEPALAGFGSSAFISISAELIGRLLTEIIDAIHQAGALAGIHVCANTDWSLAFDSTVDIINLDAYNYFDKFAIYNKELYRFIERGGSVAWGMTPTGDERSIQSETAETLAERCMGCIAALATPEVPREKILAHSLFTPTCGCGTLSEANAERVVQVTGQLGRIMKAHL